MTGGLERDRALRALEVRDDGPTAPAAWDAIRLGGAGALMAARRDGDARLLDRLARDCVAAGAAARSRGRAAGGHAPADARVLALAPGRLRALRRSGLAGLRAYASPGAKALCRD